MDKKKFLQLQAKWDKKLKKSGFKDLESRQTGQLENNSTSGGPIDRRRITWELQAQYFGMASDFLNDYDFENDLDKRIWTQHALSSDGISENFLNKLNRNRKYKLNKFTAWTIVKRLEAEMKIMYGVK